MICDKATKEKEKQQEEKHTAHIPTDPQIKPVNATWLDEKLKYIFKRKATLFIQLKLQHETSASF